MTAAWNQPLVNANRPAEVPAVIGRSSAEGPPAETLDFQQWVEGSRSRLVRLAYRYLWNSHDAEEIVQDAVTLAWREVGAQARWKNRDAWLYRVTINLCLNRLRRVQAGPLPAGEMLTAASGQPEQPSAEAGELADRLRLAIRELPERQQAALVLRDIEGLEYEQIAVILEVRKGAARLLVHRAREALRQTLLRRWPDSFG